MGPDTHVELLLEGVIVEPFTGLFIWIGNERQDTRKHLLTCLSVSAQTS